MRNIVVTGGSRGLGLGIARKIAGGGDRVIAVARKMNGELAGAIDKIRQSGQGSLDFIPFDLGDVDDIPSLLSSTVGSEAWNSRDLKSRPH